MSLFSLWHRPQKFTNYDPDSPASRAARKWDEREGGVIEQNEHLRKLLTGTLVAIIALAGGLTYKALSDPTTVYVVETDLKTGEIRNVGTAQQMASFKPSEQMYSYFIKKFIQDVRTVPLDEVVFANNIKEAYHFVTQTGADILTSKLKAEGAQGQLGKETVQVDITSLLPMEGGKSYQARWMETKYGAGQKQVTAYTGVFTIEILKSDKKEGMDYNPLGIYISDMQWQKDAPTADATQKGATKS